MLIRECTNLYLDYCLQVKLVQPSTAEKYRDCLETWIVPTLGDKEVGRLKRVDVGVLRAQMFSHRLSIARTYSVLMVLKGFLLYIKDVLKLATLDPREVEVPNRGRPHVVYLTDLELDKIFRAIPVHTFSGA